MTKKQDISVFSAQFSQFLISICVAHARLSLTKSALTKTKIFYNYAVLVDSEDVRTPVVVL